MEVIDISKKKKNSFSPFSMALIVVLTAGALLAVLLAALLAGKQPNALPKS